MANWELLPYRMDGHKIIRRAQCPYCDYIVEYTNNGFDFAPYKCPDCGKELDYERKCEHYVGFTSDTPTCKHRGSCYGCHIYRQAYEEDEERE